ncbi:hypothetical protein AAFF_G00257060 [Aldrovandia affinis]|uniref:TGF-beta family profile domain-containing protein n=1 Tax=Aldrovandia affinis TaxID=143900 RepID=A0AAD7SU95_9TELE|nr:hypothetical protein AAFF_G00257060 [Aldrovandia affinis]
MKLWKCVAIGLMFCGAALSLFLTRIMLPARPQQLHSWSSSSARPSPSSSSSSNSAAPSRDGRHRTARAAEGMNSLLSELSHVFQSFTEGELKQIIATFVDKKARRDSLEASQNKRTKRARKRHNSCYLKRKVVTISQLGLGHVSDETMRFGYCVGRCVARRQNYDLALNMMRKSGVIENGKARHKPCCRPTVYEDISFLDMDFRHGTLRNVSALECSCV